MTEFAPFAPPPDAGPGAPGTVGDLYRIFGTDRKRNDAPAVAPATKLVVRKHDFSSAQTAYQRARSAPSSQLIFYKDATPRGEHYIRCSVACEPARPDVGARPAVGPFDPAAVAERRAIHEQILAINRRLENLKGSLSDLTVRLGAHSATVTLPPPTESA